MDLVLHSPEGKGRFLAHNTHGHERGGAGRDRHIRRSTHGDAGARSFRREVEHMDLTTIVIVLLVVAVLGGGGWGYSRWRG